MRTGFGSVHTVFFPAIQTSDEYGHLPLVACVILSVRPFVFACACMCEWMSVRASVCVCVCMCELARKRERASVRVRDHFSLIGIYTYILGHYNC